MQKRKPTPVSDLLDTSGVFPGRRERGDQGVRSVGSDPIGRWRRPAEDLANRVGKGWLRLDAPFCVRSQDVLFSCRSGTRSTARHGGNSLY